MGDRARAKWAEKWGLLCPFLWGTKMGQKLGSCCTPFGVGSWVPSNTLTWAEAYLCTKWHLDPPSHLATVNMG